MHHWQLGLVLSRSRGRAGAVIGRCSYLGPRPDTNLQSSSAKGHPNFHSCRSPVSELSRFTGPCLLPGRHTASNLNEPFCGAGGAIPRSKHGKVPELPRASTACLQASSRTPTVETPPVASLNITRTAHHTASAAERKASSPCCVHLRTCLAAFHAIPSKIYCSIEQVSASRLSQPWAEA